MYVHTLLKLPYPVNVTIKLGCLSGCPYDTNPTARALCLGSLDFWKLPYQCLLRFRYVPTTASGLFTEHIIHLHISRTNFNRILGCRALDARFGIGGYVETLHGDSVHAGGQRGKRCSLRQAGQLPQRAQNYPPGKPATQKVAHD